MAFDREQLKQSAASPAASGVFIGTSSWKYPGWRGMLYDESRYVWRDKVAEPSFEKYCLNTELFECAFFRPLMSKGTSGHHRRPLH
jgi:hypothetical protein